MDPSILKQYIFQKGFVTEAAKAKREAEAQNATLQARRPDLCAKLGRQQACVVMTPLLPTYSIVNLITI